MTAALCLLCGQYGNPVDCGGQNVQIRALGPSTSASTVADNGDGTYSVRFTPFKVGEYRLEARLDNTRVGGCPLMIMFNEQATTAGGDA